MPPEMMQQGMMPPEEMGQPQGGAGLAGIMQAMGGPGGMPTGMPVQQQAGGLPPELLLQLLMLILGGGQQQQAQPPMPQQGGLPF